MSDALTTFAWVCVGCAAVPAATFLWNLRHYRPPRPVDESTNEVRPDVSVLIPARNEEGSIARCVESVLASDGVEVEVVVLDDRSEDQTAEILKAIADRDPRVRLEPAPPLPAGWCGKQHACWVLSRHASHERMVFLDADVRLAPDALPKMVREAERTRVDLLSGFPTEETGTIAEKVVIPLIHFLLLGFLPIDQSRRWRPAAWAAGCGQFFLTTKAAYERAGGHAAIRQSLHDGLMLPRAFRRAGLRTDVVDLTGLARCRMYRSAGEVWNGFTKNATEGFAAPALIVPITAVLLLGQVLPPLLMFAGPTGAFASEAIALFAVAALLGYLPRWIAVWRFGQSPVGAALHPVGIVAFLAIQWAAFGRKLLGRPATWKGRPYSAGAAGGERPERTAPVQSCVPARLSGLPR